MNEQQPARRRGTGRLLALAAVVIGVLALAAGAFALSYHPVRDIALAAGVTAPLARLYPAILDAVFVIACATALAVRDARWWTRGYAWLSVLVTGVLIGAADAYHAMGLRLPHKVAAGTVAALPLVLVLLGFSLWLSMLRHARGGRAGPATGTREATPAGAAALASEAGHPGAAEPDSAGFFEAIFAPPTVLPAAADNAPQTEAAAGDAAGDDARPGQPAPRAGRARGDRPSEALTPPYGFPAVITPARAPSADEAGSAPDGPGHEPEGHGPDGHGPGEHGPDKHGPDKHGPGEHEAPVPAGNDADGPPAPMMSAPTFAAAPVPGDAGPSAPDSAPARAGTAAPAAEPGPAEEANAATASVAVPPRFVRVRSTPTPPGR